MSVRKSHNSIKMYRTLIASPEFTKHIKCSLLKKQKASTLTSIDIYINSCPQIRFEIQFQMENTRVELASAQNEKKTLYETYTDYIDPSEITINYYLTHPFFTGHQDYIDKINQWIQSDLSINKPLIFKTSPGVGIKSIFSRWYQRVIQENKSKKQKIFGILHFASNGSNSSNYFYCLYRIIIKLREALKINHNVDLLEQKIRKYFAYWLDICSTQIQKQQVIYCTQDIYQKIVIVIQGIDKFIDSQTGKQANIAFWLPQFFPKNVRVICSVGQNCQSLEYFQKKQCKIIQVFNDYSITQQILNQTLEKRTLLKEDTQQRLKNILQKIINQKKCTQDTFNFINKFSQFLLIQNSRTKNKDIIQFFKKTICKKLQSSTQLQNITNISQLYDFILNMYNQTASFKKKIVQILMYFALTQKGITIKQIIQLTKFTQQQWTLFQCIFTPVLIKHHSIYSIKCTSFIQSIIKNDKNVKQNKQLYLAKYHQKIAQALQNTPNSIRKLQEQTYHLFVAKSYFKLKQIVSTIQNFLLMFNPNNKYQLSRYWQKLQQKGFDPVIQYNKAIQGFSMHYHPSDQNIFKIIVQISRFLKQFCDFQTYQTPSFRHPFIQGNMIQLQKIGLLGQFTKLQIYVDNSFNNIDEPQNIPDSTLQEQIKQVRQQYFPKQSSQYQNIQSKQLSNNKGFDDPFIQQKSLRKIKKKGNSHILSQIQQLNVDVPMNRQKFRNYYLNTLQQFMKSQDFKQKIDDGFFQVQDQGAPVNNRKIFRTEFSVNKIKQNYKMRHIKPSLYYYKRWIWIQFPWVCISLNNNYSTAPQFCKHLQGQDIDTYQHQAKYTKQALIIAIEAKQKKKMMFTKKSDDLNGFLAVSCSSKIKYNTLSSSKYPMSRNVEKSNIRTKVMQKTFCHFDLSLNALTKQLETRKKNMPIDTIKPEQKQNTNKQGIFISEINQVSQQDMKFINQRKQFEKPDIDNLPSNQILPKLKWVIKDHTNYEIVYIKDHIEQKKKKLNKIIYQNKKLSQIYKQLKVKQNLTKKNIYDQQCDKHTRKTKILQQFIKKKQQVITQFCKSLLQKQRLKIILKLCAQNKIRNEQYLASLNYFLQNIKKMINWQKTNVKQITNEMNGMKSLKQKKQSMQQQKQKNNKILQKQIKIYLNQKSKLQQQIQNISIIITQDLKQQKNKLEYSLEGHLKNKQEKNKLLIQQKKTKQLQQKLKSLQSQYQSLNQLFQLDGTQLENSSKFKQLLQQNQKNKKLKIIYFQKKNKLQEIQKQHQKIKQIYQKIKSQKKYQIHQFQKENYVSSYQQKKIAKQQQGSNKNNNLLKIIINNISLKLGVKNTNEIVPFLKKKLNQLRLTNPLKYQQIMGKKLIYQQQSHNKL